jgi:transcriptional repressor of cell division inhibition gene dicB
MLKAAVLAHFDNSPVTVARALGITRSAVNQWPDLVPLKSALRLQAVTNGALKVDLDVYEVSDLSVHSEGASARPLPA